MNRPAARTRLVAARFMRCFARGLGNSTPRAPVCLLVCLLALFGLWRAEERHLEARISRQWSGPRNGGGK